MTFLRNSGYYTDFYFERKRIIRKVPGGIKHTRLAAEYEHQLKGRLSR